MVCNDSKVGVIWKFGQVYSCFGLRLPLGLMYFVGFGGVSGSRGVWVEEEAYLVINSGEGGVGRKFSKDPTVLGSGSR